MNIKSLKPLGRFVNRYKYAITTVVFLAIIVFIDENSFVKRWEYSLHIKDLKADIDKYEREYERDSSRLYELKTNPRAITKVARERYMMKTDDEDIFVLSTDNKKNEQKDETAK